MPDASDTPESTIERTPAAALWLGFVEVLRKQMTTEDYLSFAGSQELARIATRESVEALAGLLDQASGRAALMLADAVESHALSLDGLHRSDLALPLYQAARRLFVEYAPPDVLAGFHFREGCVWQHLARFIEAASAFDLAIDAFGPLVHSGRDELANDLARALNNKGIALERLGRLVEATAAYERAIALRQSLVDAGRAEVAKDLASAFNNKGIALRKQGRFAEAVLAFDRAIEIRQELVATGRAELTAELAGALNNKGNVFQSQGSLAEAASSYDRAIEILRPLVDSGRSDLANALASAVNNKGETLRRQGNFEEAVSAFDRVIEIRQELVIAGRADLAADLAGALNNKGIALQQQGRLAEAVPAFDRAIEILQQLMDSDRSDLANDFAGALNNKGITLQLQGRLAEAVSAYDRAIEVRQRLVDSGRSELASDLAGALNNKGGTLQLQGSLAEATSHYDRAIANYRKLVDAGRADLATDLARSLNNKGGSLQLQGRFPEATSAHDRAIEIYQPLVDSGRSELASDLAGSLLNKGNSLANQGEWAGALAVLDSISPESLGRDNRRKYHWAFTDVLWRIDRRAEALQHAAAGRKLLREARRIAGIDETTIEYVAQRERFIDQCVRFALELDRDRDAFAAVLDGKGTVYGDARMRTASAPGDANVLAARANLTTHLRRQPAGNAGSAEPERLRDVWRAELKSRTDYYLKLHHRAQHPTFGASAEPIVSDDAPPDLAAIQAALPNHWAILDFWRLDDESIHVFAVTRAGLTVHKLAFPIAAITPGVNQLIAAMADPLDPRHSDKALDDLHAYLFAPLLPWLRERQITGLYLVPHGFLHALPLHAARNNGAYLCDTFDVAYLPSSSLLPHLPKLDVSGPVFSLANPERGTPHSLEEAEREGEELERRCHLKRGGHYHRGPDATYARTADWGEAALVHFSGHGVGDDRFAPLSHLRLADDLLLAHDVAHRTPPLRRGALVTLNGCQTSVRDVRAHNESMGLMTAFLMRGAGLVLATQWSVRDRVAADLLLDFVEQLLDHDAKPTDALRRAVRKVRGLPLDDPPSDAGRTELRGLRPLDPNRPLRQAKDTPLLWAAFQLVGRVE